MKIKTAAIVCFILGVLTLFAACAPNYANVDPDTPVNIPDPRLKKAVIETLQMQGAVVDGDRLTAGDLRKIEAIYLNGPISIDTYMLSSDIQGLSGIEYASNLTTIQVFAINTGGLDLRPLSGLTNLTRAILSENNISDISPLSGLKNLKSLELSNNSISDLSPLSGLNNLESLTLSGNKISNLSPISGLKNLTVLLAENIKISDISPLSELTNLEYLCLPNNNISDVSPLSGLKNLKYLDLRGNKISDLSPLNGLTELLFMFIDQDTYDSNKDTVEILEQRGCEIDVD